MTDPTINHAKAPQNEKTEDSAAGGGDPKLEIVGESIVENINILKKQSYGLGGERNKEYNHLGEAGTSNINDSTDPNAGP